MNTCVPGTKPINGMYPACKFALTALTECLRQEVSYIEMGVKVSVRCEIANERLSRRFYCELFYVLISIR